MALWLQAWHLRTGCHLSGGSTTTSGNTDGLSMTLAGEQDVNPNF